MKNIEIAQSHFLSLALSALFEMEKEAKSGPEVLECTVNVQEVSVKIQFQCQSFFYSHPFQHKVESYKVIFDF